MPRIKDLVSRVLLALGYSIDSKAKSVLLRDLSKTNSGRGVPASDLRALKNHSKSQLGQDIFALLVAGLKEPGYFVEFGAGDGIGLSNTHLLEKHHGWSGIMCEPGRNWHEALKKNRGCVIDFRCVFSKTGQQISFSENYLGELSGITEFTSTTEPGIFNKTLASYQVETISLVDLLINHQAPNYIDFLSVDTEGSELEILKAFDFSKFSFGAICVEHNFSANREKVKDLLLANGYRQVYSKLSDFDDWFVQATNLSVDSAARAL